MSKMKRRFSLLLLLTLPFLGIQGCTDIDDTLQIPSDLMVQNFIWKGLNLYYLWKDEVPDLADKRFANQPQLNNYLYTKGTPEQLFQDLLYKPISKYEEGTATDRFSVLVHPYTYLENLFQGKVTDNGAEFKLLYKDKTAKTDVFGWVKYIVPGSDAAGKDIHRGDIFYAVDGVPLNNDNYSELLSAETYTLNLADYDGGNITPNGKSVILTKTEINENPIFYRSVIPVTSHKVAYLMYNGFISNYDSQLNNVFGEFAAAGATDLVLDLRYNSGGSVQSAVYLASMITGQFNGQLLAKEQWNKKVEAFFEKNSPEILKNNFTDHLGNGSGINSLHLNKVYVLTSKSTASASELVINGLRPYINVVQIGDVTTGKNTGSITLYDSPTFNKTNRNPHHKYAMQPLVFKMTNKAGFGDYEHGLIPTISQPEDLSNLGQIGDPNEPLLSTALSQISQSGRKAPHRPAKTFTEFKDSRELISFGTDMYKDAPEGLENLKNSL